MNAAHVQQLKIGIYRIYWKSGGSSIAAVGCTEAGGRWMAPLNWIHPSEDAKMWRGVKEVELLVATSLVTPGVDQPPIDADAEQHRAE